MSQPASENLSSLQKNKKNMHTVRIEPRTLHYKPPFQTFEPPGTTGLTMLQTSVYSNSVRALKLGFTSSRDKSDVLQLL